MRNFSDLRRIKKSSENISGKDIRYVKAGGSFELYGNVYVVNSVTKLRETDESFTEFDGFVAYELNITDVDTGKVSFLGYEFDDYLEVSFTDNKISSSMIPVNDIYNEENIAFEGQRFSHDETWFAIADDGEDKSYVSLYEYKGSSKDLTAEKWSNKPNQDSVFEFSTSVVVNSRDIKLIGLSG